MDSRFGKRVFYVTILVFIMLSSLGAVLWSPPSSVQADPAPPPTPTPTPVPPITPTVGIIAPKNEDGMIGMKQGQGWAAQNGLKVVAEQWYAPGNTDDIFRAVKVLLDSKPGYIYIGGASDKEAEIIQEILKKLGYWGRVIVGPSVLRPPQTSHVTMGWQEKGPVFKPSATPYASVVQLSPGSFVMWYWTGSWVNWATSSDGVNWSDQGAIAVSGAPPAGYQLGMPAGVFWREKVGAVWQEHFLMFVSAFKEVGGVRHYDYILVLESSDGLNWGYKGTAFADATPGVDPVGDLYSLTVIKGASGYEGWLWQGNALYYTSSADGVAWSAPQATAGLPDPVSRVSVVRLASDAVSPCVDGKPCSCGCGGTPRPSCAHKCWPSSKYVMWYGYALNPGDQPYTAIGLAFSDDGVNWTPSPENPLYKVEANTWRAERTYTPWVVLDEQKGLWRMWFTGRSSHIQENTEFLTLNPGPPTDSPAPGRFARGVSDPGSIVVQLRFPSSSQPLEGINSINDDDGNSYTSASFEPGGKITVSGWATLDGGTKTAVNENLKVYYKQRVREYRVGYAQAPTHILHDVVNKASWGDEIIVHPGAYLGQVYADEAIRLRSSHGAAVTFIDARQERRYEDSRGGHPAVWIKVEEGPWGAVPDWWLKQFGVPETRIDGFTIANSHGVGIVMQLQPGDKAKLNPRGRIVNNIVRGIDGTGMVVLSSSNDMRLDNNQVYANVGNGIVVRASAWVGLFKNDVGHNGGAGISLSHLGSGGWSYSHTEGNTVHHNGGDGIYSSMNNGKRIDNVVTDNGGHGIHLETQARPWVGGNTVSGNGGDGIHVRQAHIENNKVQGNTGTGIYIENEAWVVSNSIQNNGQHGVKVGNWAEIRNNSISSNGGDGVRAEPGAASVLDNTIQNNASGVALVGRDGSRIAGNTIASNANYGIYSTTSGNLISANQITNNRHGIWVEGDNNRILANTIQNNVATVSGVHLTASAEGNQVHYNNIVGNKPYGVFKEGTPPVDATNNWWGQASGPSGSGPGTGDGVNEHVLFTPWLTSQFSDTTAPVVAESLALPESLALYGMFDKTLGPTYTHFVVRSSDEHSGVVKAELNVRPLAEMLASDLQIPPERLAEWQSWLQGLQHYRWLGYDGVLWSHDFDLSWLVNDIANRFRGWGMGEMAVMFKLHAGEAQVPVTLYDGAGNHAAVNISFTVVDAMVPLNEGWNLRSLPIALDDDAWGHVKALGGGLAADVALRFNNATQQWQALGDADRWRPLEGVYIHTTERDQLNLIVGRSPTAPPLRDLAANWALVGPAFLEANEMPVTQALRSLEVNAAGQRGYLIATSPIQVVAYRQEYRYQLPDGTWRGYGSYDWRFGQEPWVYLSGDEWRGQKMVTAGGNWVFMEHPDTLVGYSSTPLVSGIQPEAAGSALKPAQAPASGPPPLPMVLQVTAPGSWKRIQAKAAGQVVGQVQRPDDLLLVQGDIAKGTPVSLYVDGVVADQRPAYESGKVASVALTQGFRVADINADNVVNLQDLVAVALKFNTQVPAGDPADLNGDGVVNIFDLAKVSLYFGVSLP